MPRTTNKTPKAGDVWMHHNGTEYKVRHLCNMNSISDLFVKTVVYQNVDSGELWSRPLSEWHQRFSFLYHKKTSEQQ